MFVAYILTNQRELKVKMLGRSHGTDQIFKFGIHEYEINPKYIYTKRFLYIKWFTWAMYKQGERKPLSFEDIQIGIAKDEIPLDDLTYWENKLKKDQLTKIAEIMAIIGGITSIITVVLVFQTYDMTTKQRDYLQLMGKILQELHDKLIVTQPPIP